MSKPKPFAGTVSTSRVDARPKINDRANANLNFDNLVLTGPGVNGIYFVAAALQLEKEWGSFKTIRGVAGASSGAIVAFLLALDLTAAEIQKIFLSLNIIDGPDSSMNQTILSGVLLDILFKKNCTGLTFADLKRKGLKDLRIAATRGTNEAFIFSAENTPQASVLTAVLASAATPGLFPPLYLNERFSEVNEETGQAYSDGGYSLTKPQDIFGNYTNTLYVLNCSGPHDYYPYENFRKQALLINLGQRREKTQIIAIATEEIKRIRELTKDFLHPEKLAASNNKISEKFAAYYSHSFFSLSKAITPLPDDEALQPLLPKKPTSPSRSRSGSQ